MRRADTLRTPQGSRQSDAGEVSEVYLKHARGFHGGHCFSGPFVFFFSLSCSLQILNYFFGRTFPIASVACSCVNASFEARFLQGHSQAVNLNLLAQHHSRKAAGDSWPLFLKSGRFNGVTDPVKASRGLSNCDIFCRLVCVSHGVRAGERGRSETPREVLHEGIGR